jgi:hypothetical protein
VTIPQTPELLAIARRLVWSDEPERALEQPYTFLAHVMTYGQIEDLVAVRDALGMAAFREALRHAPPGILDRRSWHYWHRICRLGPAPELPQRRFE